MLTKAFSTASAQRIKQTMQCKRTFTKRFTLSSQKEVAPF